MKRREHVKVHMNKVLLTCTNAEVASQLYLALAAAKSTYAADIMDFMGVPGERASYIEDVIGKLEIMENLIIFSYAGFFKDSVKSFLTDLCNTYESINASIIDSYEVTSYKGDMQLVSNSSKNLLFYNNPLYITVK